MSPNVAAHNREHVGNMAAMRSWKDRFTISVYDQSGTRVDRRFHCADMEGVNKVLYPPRKKKFPNGQVVMVPGNKLISDFFTLQDNGLRAEVQRHMPR